MPDSAACDPTDLADAIEKFVVRKSGIHDCRVRAVIDNAIASAGDEAVTALQAELARPAEAWSYYPANAVARAVHRRLANIVLQETPVVTGAERLTTVRGRAVILVANHLSYSDANVIEVLLHQYGYDDIASRLAVIAGPKVYTDVTRRFSSMCFGTIKAPQNEGVSSGEAAMSTRQVALAARQTLTTAHERLVCGDALLIFPEGTRSRSGGMQAFLPGVARYFTDDTTLVVPIGLCGTEQMYALGEEQLGSAGITMNVGSPVTIAQLRDAAGRQRRGFVDALGALVAEQLPAPYRGVYAPNQ